MARRRASPSRWSVSLAVGLIQTISGSEPQQEVARALERASTPARLAGAVAVVVAAPLAEELLFRGLLLRGLLRRFGAPVAVLLGGAVFAVVHLLDPSAAPLLAPLLLVGVVSGILAVRTGELSQSILLHAGFNLLTRRSSSRPDGPPAELALVATP